MMHLLTKEFKRPHDFVSADDIVDMKKILNYEGVSLFLRCFGVVRWSEKQVSDLLAESINGGLIDWCDELMSGLEEAEPGDSDKPKVLENYLVTPPDWEKLSKSMTLYIPIFDRKKYSPRVKAFTQAACMRLGYDDALPDGSIQTISVDGGKVIIAKENRKTFLSAVPSHD